MKQNIIGRMAQCLLRQFGYLKVDYGFSCGRHWIEIDGKVIAQSSGDDLWLRDEDVHRLGYEIIDHGKHWNPPNDGNQGLKSPVLESERIMAAEDIIKEFEDGDNHYCPDGSTCKGFRKKEQETRESEMSPTDTDRMLMLMWAKNLRQKAQLIRKGVKGIEYSLDDLARIIEEYVERTTQENTI